MESSVPSSEASRERGMPRARVAARSGGGALARLPSRSDNVTASSEMARSRSSASKYPRPVPYPPAEAGSGATERDTAAAAHAAAARARQSLGAAALGSATSAGGDSGTSRARVERAEASRVSRAGRVARDARRRRVVACEDDGVAGTPAHRACVDMGRARRVEISGRAACEVTGRGFANWKARCSRGPAD